MGSKKEIIKNYQKEELIDTFDSTRSETYGHVWRNNYEKNLVLDSLESFKKKKIKVLDVACGTGRVGLEILKYNPDIEYQGLDTSKPMIKKLKSKLKEKRNISLHLGDASNLPFKDEEFDLVYSFHLLWHLERKDQRKIVEEMMRVTKKGGILIFDALNKNSAYNLLRPKFLFKDNESYMNGIRIKEIKKYFGNTKTIDCRGVLDPHIKNKILFRAITFIPNKIFKKNHFLHHMLYFKIKNN
ncbi:MAG: class I SAM-dependent methyltransferase [Nanoarchaeota archaeon]